MKLVPCVACLALACARLIAADAVMTFNELMYHPAGTNEVDAGEIMNASSFFRALCKPYLTFCGLWCAGSLLEANPPAIALDQTGATAQKQYSGDDGLSVSASSGSARLKCVIQKLEGEVTCEGLWLNSTADESIIRHGHYTAVDCGWRAWFGC
jgi:hypothetical protein